MGKRLVLLFCIFLMAPVYAGEPDRAERIPCEDSLNPPSVPSDGESFEELRRRLEPGPDEVEDRNVRGDAVDPGEY